MKKVLACPFLDITTPLSKGTVVAWPPKHCYVTPEDVRKRLHLQYTDTEINFGINVVTQEEIIINRDTLIGTPHLSDIYAHMDPNGASVIGGWSDIMSAAKKMGTHPTSRARFDIQDVYRIVIVGEGIHLVPVAIKGIELTPANYTRCQELGIKRFYMCTFKGEFSGRKFDQTIYHACDFGKGLWNGATFVSCSFEYPTWDIKGSGANLKSCTVTAKS